MQLLKKYWWIVLGALFLVMYLTTNKAKDQKNSTQISEKALQPGIVKKDVFPETLKTIEKVNWGNSLETDFPEKLPKLIATRKIIDSEKENKIKNYFGGEGTNLYIQKELSYIQYSNMPENPQNLPITASWDENKLKSKLKKIVSDLNEENNMNIEWINAGYRKYVQPYMLEAGVDEAQFMEITGDYVIEGMRSTTFHGEAIRAFFDGEGNLLKLSLYLKPDIGLGEGSWQIMSLEEAKNSPISNFRAGVNDLYNQIETVNANRVKLVNIFSNEKNTIKPFFIFEGSTYSEHDKKPVNINVLLEATR